MGKLSVEERKPHPHPQWYVPAAAGSLVDMRPQGLVESLKAGPVGYIAAPAAHHQLKERRWAEWRGVEENLVGRYRDGKRLSRHNFAITSKVKVLGPSLDFPI